jgi:hypothetical protein
LKNIKEKVSYANTMNDAEKKHKEEFEKRVENVKQHLKAALEESVVQAADFPEGMMGMEFLDDPRRKG